MTTLNVIETPELIFENWLATLDKWITPLAPIDKEARNYLEQFNVGLNRQFINQVDREQLTGPLMDRMLYQYCAIVGQLEKHVRIIPIERLAFLERAMDVYGTNIDWIEREYCPALNPSAARWME